MIFMLTKVPYICFMGSNIGALVDLILGSNFVMEMKQSWLQDKEFRRSNLQTLIYARHFVKILKIFQQCRGHIHSMQRTYLCNYLYKREGNFLKFIYLYMLYTFKLHSHLIMPQIFWVDMLNYHPAMPWAHSECAVLVPIKKLYKGERKNNNIICSV